MYVNNELAYRNLSSEKPPFNYAQIIAMAMMERGRMTLKDICTWIRDRFAYYRAMDNWNNSIRHNLSLHFCFTKIARDKSEKGKGGYWELSMNVTKGEKKRVRNRSKRALAAIAAAAAAAGSGPDGHHQLSAPPRAKRTRRSVAMRHAPNKATTTTTSNNNENHEFNNTTLTMKHEVEEIDVAMSAQLNDAEMAATEAAATAVAQELCATFASSQQQFASMSGPFLPGNEVNLNFPKE